MAALRGDQAGKDNEAHWPHKEHDVRRSSTDARQPYPLLR